MNIKDDVVECIECIFKFMIINICFLIKLVYYKVIYINFNVLDIYICVIEGM